MRGVLCMRNILEYSIQIMVQASVLKHYNNYSKSFIKQIWRLYKLYRKWHKILFCIKVRWTETLESCLNQSRFYLRHNKSIYSDWWLYSFTAYDPKTLMDEIFCYIHTPNAKCPFVSIMRFLSKHWSMNRGWLQKYKH